MMGAKVKMDLFGGGLYIPMRMTFFCQQLQYINVLNR